MGLANVPWECALGMDYPMYSGNETSQCSLGMELANVLYELDYPMCPGNGASHCALGMELANTLWNSQCALGMGLANVPWEWD